MVFDDSAARTTAIPTPSEGMVTYLKDTDALEQFDGSNFVGVTNPAIGSNVVQTVKTNVFSMASATFTAVTGLSATITPTTATSKVLIIAQLAMSPQTVADASAYARITGGNTSGYIGDAASNRTRAAAWVGRNFTNYIVGFGSLTSTLVFVDSPNTTSATTYGVEMRHGSTGTVYLNRSGQDDDNANNGRLVSSITVMEVAG